jgi:hypothetical protein
MHRRLRLLDRGGAHGASQKREIDEAGGSDVGPNGWARAGAGHAEDPAEQRRRKNRRDQSTDRHLAGARPNAWPGHTRPGEPRTGRHRLRKHGVKRIRLPAPERLSTRRNRALLGG